MHGLRIRFERRNTRDLLKPVKSGNQIYLKMLQQQPIMCVDGVDDLKSWGSTSASFTDVRAN